MYLEIRGSDSAFSGWLFVEYVPTEYFVKRRGLSVPHVLCNYNGLNVGLSSIKLCFMYTLVMHWNDFRQTDGGQFLQTAVYHGFSLPHWTFIDNFSVGAVTRDKVKRLHKTALSLICISQQTLIL
jgi:hypothetical protein